MAYQITHGRDLIVALAKAGIVPELTQHVIIEASLDDLAKIYVQAVAGRELIHVELPQLSGAKVVTVAEGKSDE